MPLPATNTDNLSNSLARSSCKYLSFRGNPNEIVVFNHTCIDLIPLWAAMSEIGFYRGFVIVMIHVW